MIDSENVELFVRIYYNGKEFYAPSTQNFFILVLFSINK